MATLDHTSYPHILDLILAFAPRSALLALRAASREFRRRADTIICHHVELHLCASSTPSWHLASASSCPSTSSNTRLPLLPGDTHGACLSTTRILKVRTPPSQRRMARKDLLLPALYLPVHTVRLPDPFLRLSIDGLAPQAQRLVIFEEIGRSFNCDKTGWFFPPTVGGTRVPCWAKEYILNISVRPDEPELHTATWENFAVLDDDGRVVRVEVGETEVAVEMPGGGHLGVDALGLSARTMEGRSASSTRISGEASRQHHKDDRSITIIFRTLPGKPARAHQTPHHTLGMLQGLVGGIAQHPSWHWTLVGVHELLKDVPHSMPAMEGRTAAEVCGYIEEMARTHVTFLGRNEYMRRRGVGELVGE